MIVYDMVGSQAGVGVWMWTLSKIEKATVVVKKKRGGALKHMSASTRPGEGWTQ